MKRTECRALAREWFVRMARLLHGTRFLADYEMFLAEPERSRALADEALWIAEVLSGGGEGGEGGGRLLDVGCGFGIHAVLLAWCGFREVVGIDPSREKLETAAACAALAGVPTPVRFVSAVADALPFGDGVFSAALSRESLSHVPEPNAALREIHRVLAAAGRIHVRDYNNAWGIPGRSERRRVWRVAEGDEPPARPTDPATPFRTARRTLLRGRFPDVGAARIEEAVRATRGFYGAALFREGLNLLGTGRVWARPEFPFRDPATGAAEERPFSPVGLPRLLSAGGFAPRLLPPRHFHAQTTGWRRRAASFRDRLIEIAYPATAIATPLIECIGVKRETKSRPRQSTVSSRLPSVTVVIPSRDGSRGGNVPRLLSDLARQSVSAPVEVVVGIFPCARAHNEGVRSARGEVIVFIDDDVRLGHERVIENLVRTIAERPEVGIAGASQLIPPTANPFQRRLAREIPRAVFPVVAEMTDTDMATHACMAIRRDLYERVGGEPEEALRADDQVLRARVRAAGYRVVVAPDSWVFHPPPPDWKTFVQSRLADGMAAAHDRARNPDLLFDAPAGAGVLRTRRRTLPFRIVRAACRLATDLAAGRTLAVASRLFHAAGNVATPFGWTSPGRREGRASEGPACAKPIGAAGRTVLVVAYALTRFQEIDAALLARRFPVARMDFLDAPRVGWLRWWRQAARRLARSRGALVWFADRHALGLALLGRLLGRPVAVVLGGYEVARIASAGYGLSLSPARRWISRSAVRLASRVVANSDFMAAEIRRVHGADPAKIVRIRHGVHFEGVDAAEPVVFPRDPVVLTVAEVNRTNLVLKGLATFREAARRAPDLRWIVTGKGEPEAVRRLLEDAPDNFSFVGFVTEPELLALYRKARFYAQLSLFEGFGMALAEAMSFGCAPVTTGVGGTVEAAGELARIVPPEDPEAVARAVAEAPPREAHEAAAKRIWERFPSTAREEALARLFQSMS